MTGLAIYLIVRGFISLIPSVTWANQVEWLGIVEVVLGVGALVLDGYKKRSSKITTNITS